MKRQSTSKLVSDVFKLLKLTKYKTFAVDILTTSWKLVSLKNVFTKYLLPLIIIAVASLKLFYELRRFNKRSPHASDTGLSFFASNGEDSGGLFVWVQHATAQDLNCWNQVCRSYVVSLTYSVHIMCLLSSPYINRPVTIKIWANSEEICGMGGTLR